MKESKQNKMHQIGIVTLKVIPVIITCLYFVMMYRSYYRHNVDALNDSCWITILPWFFMLIASFVLRFQIWHRLFLYYICIIYIIVEFGRYGIITSPQLFDILQASATLLLLISLVVYLIKHDKHHKKTIG